MSKKVVVSPAMPLSAPDAVHGVVGKKCWLVSFAYGSELHLHFGAHLSYENAKMAGMKHGSWRLGTCGTNWTIFAPEGRLSSGENYDPALAERVKVLENSRVTCFKVTGRILTVSFSNNCRLRVQATAEDDDHEIPYWELFMPKHLLVSYGPRKVWSYRRSDAALS